MENNPMLRMYEAQAIAIEKEQEIERLKKEKDELIELMKKLGRVGQNGAGKSDGRANITLEDAWTAINSLQDQIITIENGQKQIWAVLKQLQQTAHTSKSVVEAVPNNRLDSLEEELRLLTRKMESNTILIMGGKRNNFELDEMFVLSRDGSEWIEMTLRLPYKTSSSGVVCLNETIYIFGGYYKQSLYKLEKDLKWQRLADMKAKHNDIINSCLEWNGSIWVFGGYNEKALKYVERYDPTTNKWIQMTDMKTPRFGAAAAVYKGKIIVCGGWTDDNICLKSVECLDPASGVWTILNDMPCPVSDHFLVSHGSKLIVVGATANRKRNCLLAMSNLEEKGEWRQLPIENEVVLDSTTAKLGKELFLIGGVRGNEELNRVNVYNGQKWHSGPTLNYPGQRLAAITISNSLADVLCPYRT